MVSLVITIIILIILATVTINAVFGEGGLIKQAQLSKDIAANSTVAEDEYLNRLMQEHANLLGEDGKLPIGSIIPIENYEQLLKIGSGEEIEINGIIYKFDLGKTYELQNDIEFTGYYDDIANLIKNNEVEFRGQDYKIVVTTDNGIKEYYTEESKYYIATNKYGYVSRGLELYYDGIDNTGSGHSTTTTTWKDLSGNNREGILGNFGTSAISGWNKDYLSFDGVNDWVNCGEINCENITLEAAYRLKSNTKGDRSILGNWETGGNGISVVTEFKSNVYNNSEYKDVFAETVPNSYKNKILTHSMTYNGQEEILYIDGQNSGSLSITGIIEKPSNNTIMAIGCNPEGKEPYCGYSDIDVYAIRIYNRGLSQEEIELNNKVDNRRFKNQETVPVYTEDQLLKIGSGEQVLVEQENRTYTYGTGVRYELKNDITTSGNYANIISKINNKEVEILSNEYKIANNGVYYTGNSKYTIAVNKYGYVTNGLQLLYDGIDNTGSGHSSSTTTWKDLSGNNRNGTLRNMTASSAWGSEGLKFDGIDDYVIIAEMNYDNVTLETVASAGIASGHKKIVSNIESGGYSIYMDTPNVFGFQAYISESSEYVPAPTKGQDRRNDSGKKYSISGSYDNKMIKLRTSYGIDASTSYGQNQLSGTIGKTGASTYMAIGTNPYGNTTNNIEFFDGEVSSVRIYNRALTDEENAVNFLNDRDRYNV